MKRNRICIFMCVVMVCLLFNFSASAAEMITNGGFDKNINGWTPTRATTEIVKKNPHSGEACVKVSTTSAYGELAQPVNLEKNVSYEVTAWVRVEGDPVNAQMIFSHGNSEYGFVSVGTRVTNEWTKMSAVYKYSGKNKTGKATFFLQLDYANGCPKIVYYLDDVTIKSIGESGPVYRETEVSENELVSDMGFDSGVDDYVTKNAAASRIEGDGYDNSRYCAAVSTTGAYGSIGQKLKLKKGTEYLISAAVKMDMGQSAFSYSIGTEEDNKYYSLSDVITDKWDKIQLAYKYYGEDDAEITIALRAGNDNTTFYVDDFSVIPVSTFDVDDSSVFLPENPEKENRVAINGKPIQFRVAPYVENDYMLVSLSELAKELNLDYSVNGDDISIKKGKKECYLKLGSSFASDKSSIAVWVQAPAMRLGRVMIPVGYVLRALDFDFSFDAEANTVCITADEIDYHLSGLMEQSKAKKLTVGYIGGQVTNGDYLTNPPKNSWRAKTTAWLSEYFDDCEVTEINASISYSDSVLAAYRIDSDLLSHNPDIVFIDFAYNDEDNADAAKTLEAMIAKIKAHNSKTAVVCVNTASRDILSQYINKQEPQVIKDYKKVVEYYDVLSVNGAEALAKKISNESGISSYVLNNAISKDNAHTLYFELVRDCVEKSLRNAGEYKEHKMPEPLDDEYFEARLVNAEELNADGFTLKEEKRPYLFGKTKDCILEYEFEGTDIGVFWQAAPDTGSIEYSIDSEPYKTAYAQDFLSARIYMDTYTMLGEDLKDGKHSLKIRVKGDNSEGASDCAIKLYGLLIK